MRDGVLESLAGAVPAGVPEPHRRDHRVPPARSLADSQDRRPADRAPGRNCSSSRDLRLEVTERATKGTVEARLRSAVRRPAAEASDSAGAAESAGVGAVPGRVPRGQHDPIDFDGGDFTFRRSATATARGGRARSSAAIRSCRPR